MYSYIYIYIYLKYISYIYIYRVSCKLIIINNNHFYLIKFIFNKHKFKQPTI